MIKGVQELNGGEKHRVCVEAKIFKKADVHHLDEACSGVFQILNGKIIILDEEGGVHLHGELLELKIIIDEEKDFFERERDGVFHLVTLKPLQPGEIDVDRKEHLRPTNIYHYNHSLSSLAVVTDRRSMMARRQIKSLNRVTFTR